MACRLNQASRSFDKAADNLARRAQPSLSREALRQLAESEGRAVLDAERSGKIPLGWDAGDCFTHDERGRPTTFRRIYPGSDGVMVPTVGQQEKDERRAAVKAKRRRRGRKCRPLPRARPGAGGPSKGFKIVTHYDEPAEHRLVVLTRRDRGHAGILTRQAAARVGLNEADDKVAPVDGAGWMRDQLTGRSLPLDAIGLDFYHSAEDVHKARRAVYGEREGEDGPGFAWAAGGCAWPRRATT